MEKFGVLMSVYYKEQSSFLDKALKSIFEQNVLPAEVILVKDGSLTKELDLVIERFSLLHSEIKIVDLPKNVGLGNALNEGLKHCTYDIIARMDSDDISKKDRFEKQLDIFDQNPDLSVVGAWIDEFEGDILNIKSNRKVSEFHEDIYRFARRRNPINHPVVMFRKKAVIEAGGYLDFPFFEDYFLWIRMLMNGAKFYNIQNSLLYFRFSLDVFKRRGGWKYAIEEFRFQNTIRKIGFISFSCFFINVIIRFATRIIPNRLRVILYKKHLRK